MTTNLKRQKCSCHSVLLKHTRRMAPSAPSRWWNSFHSCAKWTRLAAAPARHQPSVSYKCSIVTYDMYGMRACAKGGSQRLLR